MQHVPVTTIYRVKGSLQRLLPPLPVIFSYRTVTPEPTSPHPPRISPSPTAPQPPLRASSIPRYNYATYFRFLAPLYDALFPPRASFQPMSTRTIDLSVKTVIIGDSGVGKTCLLTRFIRDYFDEGAQPTLGVEFMAKVVATPKRRIELQLWDTAGQELFRSVTRGYYRGALVAYLVYDITAQSSFENLEQWIKDVKEVTQNDVITVLIGNKSDLTEQRAVSESEGRALAASLGIPFLETSAKNSQNVEAMFISIAKFIYEKRSQRLLDADPGPDVIALKSGRSVTVEERGSYCGYC